MRNHAYFLVNKVGPESCLSAGVGMGGQKRVVRPCLVYVLDDCKRLADGFAVVDEDGDHFVDGIHLEEKWRFVEEVFFLVFV